MLSCSWRTQPGQPVATSSAPLAAMAAALRSPMRRLSSAWVAAKVPPRPQQLAASSISTSSTWGRARKRARGSRVMDRVRRWQGSW